MAIATGDSWIVKNAKGEIVSMWTDGEIAEHIATDGETMCCLDVLLEAVKELRSTDNEVLMDVADWLEKKVEGP